MKAIIGRNMWRNIMVSDLCVLQISLWHIILDLAWRFVGHFRLGLNGTERHL
jgi:hypothetical protein